MISITGKRVYKTVSPIVTANVTNFFIQHILRWEDIHQAVEETNAVHGRTTTATLPRVATHKPYSL